MADVPDQREQDQKRTEQALSALADVILYGLAHGLLRAQSQWALQTAVSAATMEGLGGTLILKFPAKTTDHIELVYMTGDADVTSSPGRRR